MALSPLTMPKLPLGTPATDPRVKAVKTATDFETQFVKTMLEQAFAGLSGEGPLGGGATGAEAWRSFLIDEHAKSVSARGGIGIAPYVYRDMARAAGGSLNAKV